MKRTLGYMLLTILLGITAYFTFLYFATYSEGVRAGELIKVSHKGVIFKTWEGEMSQGISGAQIFSFSVLDRDKKVIEDLQEMQGQYVKVTYVERFRTFPWWGDSKYFVINVEKEKSPFNSK
ncbi:6-phosphogluconate dehydrogenase [Flavobacterium psychrotolerans]|uniref:6-phosphogluconate dehydrogenase n=1 Tax=Flavobacterium psychrotolerans TaxID=2169410 RepID=A0A2U1JK48_9FLAO|nr:6-phosphogluconate dehydrogenase [Flavobacterium psychrotolerans]PWA05369.1 6-phosphogluconate dehydrogenase [Flavobacterium psychrotolerans]